MISLVVGADGRLGSALMDIVPGAVGTTRRHHDPTDAKGRLSVFLDLATWSRERYPETPPPPNWAYLVAGTNGFRECEGNVDAFRADVDGNLRIARWLLGSGAFVVFVSTNSVEWSAGGYARNRLLVEMALVMHDQAAVVRAEKFDAASVGRLARFCRAVGEGSLGGVHHWNAASQE